MTLPVTYSATVFDSENLGRIFIIWVLNLIRNRKLKMMANWRLRNPDAKKNWDAENQEHVSGYRKSYQSSNKESIRRRMEIWKVKNRTRLLKRKKAYYQANRSSLIKLSILRIKRLMHLPHFKFNENCRKHIKHALKGKSSGPKTESIIGCSSDFLRQWFEGKFTPEMRWDNLGVVWETDHIFPVTCLGKNIEEIKKGHNYLNLRPILCGKNDSKNSQIIPESLTVAIRLGIKEIHLFSPHQITQEMFNYARMLGFKIFENYKTA